MTINPKYGGTRGYTLVEMMVVLVVAAVLTSFGIPRFTRALEQSRADVAGANLRAIWTAERIYWLDNRTYTNNLSYLASDTPPSQEPPNPGYSLLDPSIMSDPYYTYVVTVPDNDPTTFTVTAQRATNVSWSGTITITHDGILTGTLTCSGQADIVVGF